jgi:hypothetical protein
MEVRSIRTPSVTLESEAPLLWPARVLWFLLPLSVGAVLRDALASWSSTPAVVGAVLLYAAWLAGLVALVALHPWSFTVLRIVAPLALIAAVVSMRSASLAVALIALVHAMAACGVCLHGSIAQASAQAAGYGDEVRRPLRTPPLLCIVIGIAVLLVAAGTATGPLLLADGRIGAGVVCTVLGLPLAGVLVRSLHSLARRVIVFVPAGFVVSDPLAFPDPVLLPRERIVRMVLAPPAAQVDGIDTRLGALAGAVVVELDEPGSFTLRRGRAGIDQREASSLWCTPQRPSSVLATARERRLGAVTPPRA